MAFDMKLKTYLDEHDISVADFANTIRRTPKNVYALINGEYKPNPETTERILKATKGEVRPDDFYDMPRKRSVTRTTSKPAAV